MDTNRVHTPDVAKGLRGPLFFWVSSGKEFIRELAGFDTVASIVAVLIALVTLVVGIVRRLGAGYGFGLRTHGGCEMDSLLT